MKFLGEKIQIKKRRKNDEDRVNQSGKLMRPKLHSPSTHLVVSRIVLHQEWEGGDYIMHPKNKMQRLNIILKLAKKQRPFNKLGKMDSKLHGKYITFYNCNKGCVTLWPCQLH